MAKLTAKQKKKKQEITDYLKDKGIYEDVDLVLVDELIFNLQLIEELKEDLETRGVVVPINSSGTLFNSNPSLNGYNSALKQVLSISRVLGLSARARAELKINTEEEIDGFDD